MAKDDPSKPAIDLKTFLKADPDQALAGTTSVDCYDLWRAFAAARDRAEKLKQAERGAVYNVLANACSLALRADEGMHPFAAMIQLTTGSSAGPDMLREYAATFAELAPHLKHPALRARLADLGWVLGKRHDAARLAIAGYGDCLKRLLAGKAQTRGKRNSPNDMPALDFLRRACVIQRQVRAKGDEASALGPLAKRVRARARRRTDVHGFIGAAVVELDFGLTRAASLGKAAEQFAIDRATSGALEAPENLWSLAARAYERADRREDTDRALREVAESQVRIADGKSHIPMFETHWLEKAISTLRRFKGTNARRAELQARLVRCQGDISDFMVPMASKLDIKDLVDLTRSDLAGRDLTDALLIFAQQTGSPDIDELRKTAAESFSRTPLANIFAPMVLDSRGKPVARLPAMDFAGQPDEPNLRFKIIQHEEMRRALTLASQIEPARVQIVLDHQPDARTLTRLASLTPFIPPGREYIFGRGFAHFFNADFLEAAHLLVPQLEASLRYVLESADVDTSRIKSDLTQANATLSSILDEAGDLRRPLEALLGEETVFEIDNLFNHPAGPALRHRMAHGLFSQGTFFGADVRYACWMIYRLCIEQLVDHADEVRRQLQAA
ncbi:MAG: hypothetical protein JWR80_6684 [Bradyrhizobium sp.]|nr:hypothetical protein [Bradyrhizobium sp.]